MELGVILNDQGLFVLDLILGLLQLSLILLKFGLEDVDRELVHGDLVSLEFAARVLEKVGVKLEKDRFRRRRFVPLNKF